MSKLLIIVLLNFRTQKIHMKVIDFYCRTLRTGIGRYPQIIEYSPSGNRFCE